MENIQITLPVNLKKYLKDIKELKDWCYKNGIIFITNNLPKREKHARRFYVVHFDITFGFLFLSASVSDPNLFTDYGKYEQIKSFKELKLRILETKYSKHYFENKNHVKEYRKGEVNKDRVV